MSFEGFPERAQLFYEGLEADNSKAYWTDSKDVYDRCVAEPFRELLTDLEPAFGPGKLFRPYRDVRFSKDNAPLPIGAPPIWSAARSPSCSRAPMASH